MTATDKDVSVLIPTHERADSLEETLLAMAALDLRGLRVEFVVIENACTDRTSRVTASAGEKLPLRSIVAPTPGKNRALNRALSEGKLGRIVVFTDDDITPERNWLQEVVAACARHPDFSVFGGKIDPVWPSGPLPGWTKDRFVLSMGFAVNDLSTTETEYPPEKVPFGPNYWIRREVVTRGRRFLESLGPHPTHRTIGDETEYLRGLKHDGYRILHVPSASVSHRILPSSITASAIRKRAVESGRALPTLIGVSHSRLRQDHLWLHRLFRYAAILTYGATYLAARLHPDPDRRVLGSLQPLRRISYHRECLRLCTNTTDERAPKP